LRCNTFLVTDTLDLTGVETITGDVAETLGPASTVRFYGAAGAPTLNNYWTTYYRLNLDRDGDGKTIYSTAAGTVTIQTLVTSGATSANRTWLRSTVPGTAALWVVNGAATFSDNVDVEDNDASGGATITAVGSIDRGNNTNWVFARGSGYAHPRSHRVHPLAENFAGGLNPRDFLGYLVGMPGQGAAGGAGGGGGIPAPGPANGGGQALEFIASGDGGGVGGKAYTDYTLDGGNTILAGVSKTDANGEKFVTGSGRDLNYYYLTFYNSGGIGGAGLTVYRAENLAGPWTPVTVVNYPQSQLPECAFSIGPDGTLYAMGEDDLPNPSYYVWRSTDQGLTWTKGAGKLSPYPGMGAPATPAHFIWSSYAGTLFGGTTGAQNVARSTDKGDSWATIVTGIAGTSLYAPFGQRAKNLRIYGQAANGDVIYSDDDGLTWTKFSPAALGGLSGVRYFMVTQAGSLLACDGTKDLYRSTDGGNNWTKTLTSTARVYCVRQANDAARTLVAAEYTGGFVIFWISTDDGATWGLKSQFLAGLQRPYGVTVERCFHR
jgi:hypothetical protein